MRIRIQYYLLAVILCSSVTLLVLRRLNYPLTGIDDANIYLVYARNLANGHGFVYNIGGEKIEGFTSLLWTILAMLIFKLTAHVELALLIISVAITSLGITFVLVYLQIEFSSNEPKSRVRLFWPALFLTLLFTSPRYIVWNTITLMENSLWSTLLIIATILVIQDHPENWRINYRFIPISILLLLTRPESILWVSVFAVIIFLRIIRTYSVINTLKLLTPTATCIVLTSTLLILFRMLYFGYPLPNTYYAKIAPSIIYNMQQGAIYLISYFVSDPIALISIIAVILASLHTVTKIFSRQIPNDGLLFLPLIAWAGLLMPVMIGGDHFGSFRFYQNIYPILILCLLYFIRYTLYQFAGLGWKYQHQRSIFSIGVALILPIAFFISQLHAWEHFVPEIDFEFKVAKYERGNGAFAQELFSTLPELPSVGVIASGGIKYSYSGEIVDLMGLNNTIMAHNHSDRTGVKNHAAFEVATFYKLQPDIVWPKIVKDGQWQYNASILFEGWENKEGLKGLFEDPRFLSLYSYAKVSSRSESKDNFALVAWFKKNFLVRLAENTNFKIERYVNIP